jgi:hypothetical protein
MAISIPEPTGHLEVIRRMSGNSEHCRRKAVHSFIAALLSVATDEELSCAMQW